MCAEMSVYECDSLTAHLSQSSPPQFFTFEQYKKLLNLTPLSPGVVSLTHTQRNT